MPGALPRGSAAILPAFVEVAGNTLTVEEAAKLERMESVSEPNIVFVDGFKADSESGIDAKGDGWEAQ